MITAVTPVELPELIPVRMLNEFAYCPRLAYLEWVQGEWRENLDTRQGTFAHRNVDRPTRSDVPVPNHNGTPDRASYLGGLRVVLGADATNGSEQSRDDGDANESSTGEAIHARSFTLSSPEEGLIARLDLLELEGEIATPVDYKRGRVPDVPEGAYEPERVQLCAQGLILQSCGYKCDSGIIYFVESRRRVVVPFDDDLIARTRDLARRLRETAAAGVLPPPLDDSPKCPRCSLVGICLPDETNLLRRRQSTADADHDRGRVRRLLPARDDALPLYLQSQGTTLGKNGETLTLSEKGKRLRSVKLKDISQVAVFGNVLVTSSALRELSYRGVPLCHFSYGGWFHAVTSGLTHKNVELRIAQFATAADAEKSLRIARPFIVGKIKNARTLLRRHGGNDRKPDLDQLAEFSRRAERTSSADSLLGIEGMAAKVYFAGFGSLLKGGEAFDLNGRNRRPPTDPTNALLSYVYGLLVKELTITLQAVGFDPLLGFFHRPRYGRPSLALDLAEEFRPLIGDSTVLTLINNGEVTTSSFIRRAGAVALTDAGRRAVLAAFERRMTTEITHPTFGYRISYRRILEVQARLLARAVTGELPDYVPFCTR